MHVETDGYARVLDVLQDLRRFTRVTPADVERVARRSDSDGNHRFEISIRDGVKWIRALQRCMGASFQVEAYVHNLDGDKTSVRQNCLIRIRDEANENCRHRVWQPGRRLCSAQQ